MIRRFSALLLGLALVVLSVTPVAAATATPGWTIWYPEADNYHVEWSATQYTHASFGGINFDLRNNIDGGMSMGITMAWDYYNQDSTPGATKWANGELGQKPFYCSWRPDSNWDATVFRIGVKTNKVLNEYNDRSWSGYLHY